MQACARIGAPHAVVFAGFSPGALADRINDCAARVLITMDGAMRGGKRVELKSIADQAIQFRIKQIILSSVILVSSLLA